MNDTNVLTRVRQYIGRLTLTEKALIVVLLWAAWITTMVPIAGRVVAQDEMVMRQDNAWDVAISMIENSTHAAQAIQQKDKAAAEEMSQYFRMIDGYVGVRWKHRGRVFYSDLKNPTVSSARVQAAPTGDPIHGVVELYRTPDVIYAAGWLVQRKMIVWTAIISMLAMPLVLIIGRGAAYPFRQMAAALMSGRVNMLDEISETDYEMGVLKESIRCVVDTRKQTQINHQKALDELLDVIETAESGAVVVDAERERVLANLSHDMRSPLGTIRLVLDLLVSESDRALRLEAYNTATGEIDTLLGSIENVMDQSKIEDGRANIKMETLDIRALIEHQVRTKKLDAANNNINVIAEIEPDIKTFITDAEMLRRIIRNLLDNAVRFARKEPVMCKVGERGNNIIISIHDDGPGIPKEIRHKVFNAYFTTSNRANGEDGTGIGLSVAKSFVKKLGGRISLESSSEGTTFTILLPRRKPAKVVGAQKGAEGVAMSA